MFREARACAWLAVLCQVFSRYPCYVQKVAYFAAECLYFHERDRRRSESNLSVLLHDNEQLCHSRHPVIRISRTPPHAATGHGWVKKCLVSVFSRPSAALALPPQPKWHALAQKMSMHAANAMEPTARPWGIFMPARVRTEWARPRKSGMGVFHWAFSQNGRFLHPHTRVLRTLTASCRSRAPIESAARPAEVRRAHRVQGSKLWFRLISTWG